MKKLLLTTLLLFCVNAHTANLENVFGNTFINIESIKKRNGRVVFDVVKNYSVPQEAKAGWIQSEVTYGYEVDCEDDQLFNSFNTQHFSRKNGKGAKREWKSRMERGILNMKPLRTSLIINLLKIYSRMMILTKKR